MGMKPRPIFSSLALLAFLPVLCGANSAPSADAPKVITLRMIDGRTGKPIATNDFIVRINHQKTPPASAESISIHATYEASTLTYVNCDSSAAHNSTAQPGPMEHWYTVADILASGVVAPNNCIGKKVPDKLQVVAEPGQFIFFVRKLNPTEQFEQ
jgi:hypothetical protein